MANRTVFIMLINLGPQGLLDLAAEFHMPDYSDNDHALRVGLLNWCAEQGQYTHFLTRLRQLNAPNEPPVGV
jgi:hypothetical protein